MRVLKNSDLTANLCNSNSDGWEPSVASGGGVVFYTANYTAGYSIDGGDTFTQVSPWGLASRQGLNFCCDQVVQYIPQIDSFAWILQTVPDTNNENSYLLAVASPQTIKNSSGKSWKVYNLSSGGFWKQSGQWCDYPAISVGDNYLYLAFNIGASGSSNGMIARFPLSDLLTDAMSNAQYTGVNVLTPRPVQNTGNIGYFGALVNDSQLRIYSWGEAVTDKPMPHDVDIASIPTENTVSITPYGTDWLGPLTKVQWARLYGATRSGDELWFSWNGGRRVAQQSTDTFPQPHIGIAIVTTGFQLIEDRYIWNPDYAYAYPALATNADGEVGISFAQGGGAQYVQHAIGLLTRTQELAATTSGKTVGGGGHYVSIRRAYPDEKLFSAAGYNSPPDKTVNPPWVNRPYYILFGRNPCQQFIDQVAILGLDVKNFEEALQNGEIPPPPQTSARIAQFKAQLVKLQHELAAAKAQLAQCQAQNP